jgi:DNA-binding MarR family transcriptional regulator
MTASGDRDRTIEALDRLIHDPARLSICTALLNCETADFVFLRTTIGLTAGNLSSHLSKLGEAGLITVDRRLVGHTTRTNVSLTPSGRERVLRHWQTLDRIRTHRPQPPTEGE